MQICLPRLWRPGLHRSSGLQKAQAIRMTNGVVLTSAPVGGAAGAAPFQGKFMANSEAFYTRFLLFAWRIVGMTRIE